MPNIELTVTEDSPIELNVLSDTPVLLGVQEQINATYASPSPELKQALLNLAEHIAYIDDDGQTYYDALYDALFPTVSLVSISAEYTQSGTVWTDDTLDDLKADLVVTALYSDGTSETVSTYTLSGSLTSGTSTITVTYLEKTTTFDVTVTAPLYSIPDFAEQTVSSGGKSMSIKKVNGRYTMSGSWASVAYVYPDGTVSSSKSNTLWFQTIQDKPIRFEVNDIVWENSGATTIAFGAKFSQSNTTGNLATASMSMTANGSGTNDSALFENASYNARNFSSLGLQMDGVRTYSATASFTIRLFVDGVRYL